MLGGASKSEEFHLCDNCGDENTDGLNEQTLLLKKEKMVWKQAVQKKRKKKKES